MSSEEDVVLLDPMMRVAREIGKQAGVDPELMKDWYEQVCLGEMLIGEFILRIEAKIKDPALLETFRTIRRRLSVLRSGGDKIPGAVSVRS